MHTTTHQLHPPGSDIFKCAKCLNSTAPPLERCTYEVCGPKGTYPQVKPRTANDQVRSGFQHRRLQCSPPPTSPPFMTISQTPAHLYLSLQGDQSLFGSKRGWWPSWWGTHVPLSDGRVETPIFADGSNTVFYYGVRSAQGNTSTWTECIGRAEIQGDHPANFTWHDSGRPVACSDYSTDSAASIGMLGRQIEVRWDPIRGCG